MKKQILTVFSLLTISTAFSLEIQPGIYNCSYKYSDSDGDKENTLTEVEYKKEQGLHVFLKKERVITTTGESLGKEFIEHLTFPLKPELDEETQVNYHELIVAEKYKENKRKIKAIYRKLNFGYFLEYKQKLTIKIKKNGFNLSLKSVDLGEESYDWKEKLKCEKK